MQEVWAVVVCGSDFWFNVRHLNSALAVRALLLRRGLLPSQLLLLSAMDLVCAPVNPLPGCLPADSSLASNLLPADVRVDWSGRAVTVELFLSLLSGRLEGPTSLQSDERSTVLVFMSGHGGDDFFKFSDREELSAADVGAVLDEMALRRRFGRLLWVVDTCQAETLARAITAPNVTFLGSSLRGQNSFGFQWSEALHAGLNDRFTVQLLAFLDAAEERSVGALLGQLDPAFLRADPFLFSTDDQALALSTDLFFSAERAVGDEGRRCSGPSRATAPAADVAPSYPSHPSYPSYPSSEPLVVAPVGTGGRASPSRFFWDALAPLLLCALLVLAPRRAQAAKERKQPRELR